MADDKLTENVLTGAGIFIGGVILSFWKYLKRYFKKRAEIKIDAGLEYESDETPQMFVLASVVRVLPASVRIDNQESAEAYFRGLVERMRKSRVVQKSLVIDMRDVIDCNDPAAMAIAALCRDIAEHNVLKLEFIMPRKKTKANKLLRAVVTNSAKITGPSIALRSPD